MTDEIRFEKFGSYWKLPLHRKIWLNIKYWFKGLWLFLRCLSNYQKSIVENELTVLDTWGLCFSIQDARMGKSYRMIFPDEDKGEKK